ncbi:MAG: hypothetical protein Ct9H90mP9_4100 [Pseudomonadota bacterium]|nr:MAG: hypothetical protein Ct9H90mP9_4100 [Pseudomonadota bacterium]
MGWRLGLKGFGVIWGLPGTVGDGFILAEYDWRLALSFPESFRPYRFGVSEFDAERKSRISEAALRKKAEVGFARAGSGLVSLAMVTAQEVFFWSMTFLVPRLFEVRMRCFNRHCRHRSPRAVV